MAEVLPAMNIYPDGTVDDSEAASPETVLPSAEGDSRITMGTGLDASAASEQTESDGSIDIISNENGETVHETVPADAVNINAETASDEFIQGGTDGEISDVPEMLPEDSSEEYAPQPEE